MVGAAHGDENGDGVAARKHLLGGSGTVRPEGGIGVLPFDLETIDVRYGGKSYGKAVPHRITRHTHPKARPETAEPVPPRPTGIDYLNLTAAAHHEQVRHDRRIGYHALFNTGSSDKADTEQVPGQLSITDLLAPAGDNDSNEGVTA